MKFYLDITLLPNDDIGHYFLWSKVYQQLHLALVENKNTDGSSSFGVTFPEFNVGQHRLGSKLRIFSPDQISIKKLNIQYWLSKLHDYVHITSIRNIPEKIDKYVRFNRLHSKSSVERLARRAAKRYSDSYEKALEERANFYPQWRDAPFIQLKSLGNGNRFRLFILMEEVELSQNGIDSFTTYGLSKGNALPHF